MISDHSSVTTVTFVTSVTPHRGAADEIRPLVLEVTDEEADHRRVQLVILGDAIWSESHRTPRSAPHGRGVLQPDGALLECLNLRESRLRDPRRRAPRQRRLRPAEERFHSQVNLQGQEGATRARKRGVAQAQRGGRWWARPASGEIFLVLRPPPSVSRSVTERLIVERCSTFSADRIRSVAGWTMTSP